MDTKIKIAVLDDYQQVALQMADWTSIQANAELTIYHDHQTDEAAIIERLKPYRVICVMRERTPMTAGILKRLPNLKLIVSTGMRNASIDIKAAEELGITIKHTGYLETGAPEITWALLLAIARNIPQEVSNFKNGLWQTTISADLAGKTMGILGLGRVGLKIAAYAKAFDMQVIAWSPNLTAERADAAGVKLVTKEDLFKQSDFVTVHLVLSDRTRGIIDQQALELMKPSAFLVNTSRGPLVNEQALLSVLNNKKIAGAALDVYDIEPLPANHPLRTMDNVLATPHVGYVTENTYRLFYGDIVDALTDWLAI